MTCPTPTAGTVSNGTGSVGGVPVPAADAFSQKDGLDYQYQLWVELSSAAGAADRYRQNQVKAGETRLLLILVCGHPNDPTDSRPVPYRLGTYTIGQDVYDEGGPGQVPATSYSPRMNWLTASSRCSVTSVQSATGTFTLTTADDSQLAGSFDLTINGGRVTGDFTAPRVPWDGCPPRPSKTTCI